jgi:PAS domain S-box-containing protein
MRSRIDAFRWETTPLGPREDWPEALRCAMRLVLASAAPMALMAGEKGVMIYNDAYAAILGSRHPGLLGRPVLEFWPEAADLHRQVLQTCLRGGTLSLEAQETPVLRNGRLRPAWFDSEYSPVPDASGRPVGVLAASFDVTARMVAERDLAQSEAKFRTLADTMPQMVWSALPDGSHDYFNARWYEFTGVPQGSTFGEGWAEVFHADDQERAWERWRHSLATGEPYEVEYRLRHRSGVYRWTLGRALPMRDAGGHITRWFGTCTDIHEAKIAAEEREMVAQELSHRIKNIFSVLTGIIALAARAQPESKGFAEGLRGRIFAMGRAHDFVRPHSNASRPRAVQTSLRALVAELLAPFAPDGSGRISWQGEDATIDEGAATPLALLFHELGTNAAKYGALSADGGRVTIEGREEGGVYVLTWREKGGPPVSPPARLGFGSRLIGLSAEGQLGGQLKRDWPPEGHELELRVPLAALSRSARLQKQPPAAANA